MKYPVSSLAPGLLLLASAAGIAGITVDGGAGITMNPGTSITITGGNLEIRDQSAVEIPSGAALAAVQVAIAPGGTLTNCGEIQAEIVNAGEVLAPCGAGVTSVFAGDVANSGVFRVSHGTALAVTGSFTNSGLLDLITAQQDGPPPVFINTGSLIEAKDLRVLEILAKPLETELRIHGVAAHTYQLQATPDLANPAWSDIGPPLLGGNAELLLTHPGGLSSFSRYFYRVEVGDP